MRLGPLPPLERHAARLLRLSFLLDRLGSGTSGFHMHLRGVDDRGHRRTESFHLIARSGHGPFIPCMPAIILARRLARGELGQRGAMPCLGLITLDQILAALRGLDIHLVRTIPPQLRESMNAEAVRQHRKGH